MTRVFATVQVTLTIELTQPWSGTEKVENIVERARRDAGEAARRYFNGDGKVTGGIKLRGATVGKVSMRLEDG